ncbi:MAG: hypothetical protein WKF77_23065, partial [Planctomycetaceae bacterium]
LFSHVKADGNFDDLRFLAGISSCIKTLLQPIEGDQLVEFLAVASIPITTFQEYRLIPAYKTLDKNIADIARDRGLFCSADASVFATTSGMLVHAHLFPYDSAVTSNVRQRFVITGWTHSRMDGGPDQRFKHNPPVGHYVVDGYDVTIDGQKLELNDPPKQLLDQIDKVARFRRDVLLKKCLALSMSGSSRIQRICRSTAPAICHRCSNQLELVPGDFARAIGSR